MDCKTNLIRLTFYFLSVLCGAWKLRLRSMDHIAHVQDPRCCKKKRKEEKTSKHPHLAYNCVVGASAVGQPQLGSLSWAASVAEKTVFHCEQFLALHVG